MEFVAAKLERTIHSNAVKMASNGSLSSVRLENNSCEKDWDSPEHILANLRSEALYNIAFP